MTQIGFSTISATRCEQIFSKHSTIFLFFIPTDRLHGQEALQVTFVVAAYEEKKLECKDFKSAAHLPTTCSMEFLPPLFCKISCGRSRFYKRYDHDQNLLLCSFRICGAPYLWGHENIHGYVS